MDDALATIYTAHVTMLKLRHDVALEASKFDHAVIFSGALHYQFREGLGTLRVLFWARCISGNHGAVRSAAGRWPA